MSLCLRSIADFICDHIESDTLIIDSMPIPTCRIVKEKTSRACRNSNLDEAMADKSRNIIFGRWYIGYKFHLITNDCGIYRDLMVSSACVQDSYFLKMFNEEDEHLRGKELLGDRGYIGQATQLSLFEN